MIRQKVDYGKYRYSQKEILKYIGESAALCGAVDYLFYQTPWVCLLYTSPSPRDRQKSRMPSSA